jgi:small nuclear ribonucleoprotein (snRNP)-like protein
MKTLQLITVIISIIFLSCNAPHYTTVNDMAAQPANITLENGTQLKGKINVKSFDNYSNINTIQFAEGTSKDYKSYNVNELKNLFINGSTYCAKNLIEASNWGGSAIRFVKQLTMDGGKMNLFEYEKITTNTSNSNNKVIEYYVQLPNENSNKIYNIESSKFTPNFDDKMSSFVSDCSALVAKIKSKNKDYFYPFVVNNGALRRKAVLLQIINDYNDCK